jgi:lysophospholipase L1-like esterase
VTAIAASVAALAVVAGCASAGASSGRPAEPPSPRTLTVVGDSLTIQGEKPVRSALSDAGWFAALDAFPGRTTATQMDTLRAAAARANDATIVELGTNDALAIARGGRTLAEVDADIVAALDLFGDRCVVWVIPDRDPERKGVDAGAEVDAVVTREAARRSTVHVADMATVLDRHPDYLGPDRVHLTGEGYEALASVMADAMTACA